ncbi:hypothetical protein ABZP36_018105 [Zizania latifolia]
MAIAGRIRRCSNQRPLISINTVNHLQIKWYMLLPCTCLWAEASSETSKDILVHMNNSGLYFHFSTLSCIPYTPESSKSDADRQIPPPKSHTDISTHLPGCPCHARINCFLCAIEDITN